MHTYSLALLFPESFAFAHSTIAQIEIRMCLLSRVPACQSARGASTARPSTVARTPKQNGNTTQHVHAQRGLSAPPSFGLGMGARHSNPVYSPCILIFVAGCIVYFLGGPHYHVHLLRRGGRSCFGIFLYPPVCIRETVLVPGDEALTGTGLPPTPARVRHQNRCFV
jgi:hypothetical protein